ncbi:glutamate receptor 2.7 [Ziziphus jujuba]|uniref:Glutamate receptor n=1 Tax=Ziziphus jujuba TaxID=326968 RepID=A0ABM3I5P5_ZIZJJ|nr:glutamate receptor 2.7 [Ziziphus jujuba]
MYRLFPLYLFLILVLISTENFTAADHKIGSETMKDGGVVGILGAIVDNTSRACKEEKVAMKMAIEDFNSNTNQTLILHIINSYGDPLQAALAARDLISKQQVKAILGPQTWEETSLVAKVGSENHVPVLSFAEDTPKWANEIWPFLVQASPDQSNQMKAIAAIVKSWEWFQVTVIYEEGDSSASKVLPQLSYALKEVGAEITHFLPLPPFVSSSLLSEELERLKGNQTRVFVVHLSSSLGVSLFEKAKGMNMMENGYVWIATDPFTSLVHSFNSSIISSMQGVLGVKRYISEDSDPFRYFDNRFRKRFRLEHPEEDNYEPGIFAVQAYDAAMTVAYAMKKSSKLGGQNLLENILQSKFQGLTGKVEFSTNQKLPPADIFQIINVMGKSYRELGFWSEKSGFSVSLGENAKNCSSMGDLGQVFWPGAPTSTPKCWTPTNSKPLRIGVPNLSTFQKLVKVEQDNQLGNNFSFSGLSIEVFKETLKKLPYNFPYEFIPYNDGTYDSLVEQIHLKNFDAVVGDVAILAKRQKHAEFTQAYTEPGLMMVVPVRQETRNRAWLFMKPFTTSMWVFIVLVNVYNGFVVWFIERNHCPELKGSMINQIGTLIWLAFSTLFSLHGDKLHSNLSRMTMVVWLFVALVITQTYTANLTSMLTVQRLEPTIANVDILRSTNAMVGYSRGSYVRSYLNEVLGFKDNNIKNFSTPEEHAKALRSREIAAAFLEVPLAKLFLAKHCKGFVTAGPTYKVGGFGYAFPRGSPMLPSINEALLKVCESGKLLELEEKMLASEKCEDVDEEGEESTKSLSINSFWLLFIITGTISTIALVFYLCLLYKSKFEQKNWMWRLMMVVMKYWGYGKGRFSRRVSDVPESGRNSVDNGSDSHAHTLV